MRGGDGPASDPDRPRAILMTGTFDVRNYGDLLFPLIAVHRLGQRFDIRAASPLGRGCGWADTAPVTTPAEALAEGRPVDGLLIGGGNIVHADPVTLPAYVQGGVAARAYPSLWLDATKAAAARGVPVAWNAPGVPAPLDAPAGGPAATALDRAGYLSVRDAASRAFLGSAGARAEVVPDPALDLGRMWSKRSLENVFGEISDRAGSLAGAPLVAVHVKQRSLSEPPDALAAKIARFCRRHGVVPVLIGIGACHGDDELTARIVSALPAPRVDLSRPAGLREIAAAIAHARVYVGASMHGYVTAAAYGVPGAIVGRPRLVKMAGLLDHLGRRGDEAANWDEALGKAALRLSHRPVPLPPTVTQALDRHWDAIRRVFSSTAMPKGTNDVRDTAGAER